MSVCVSVSAGAWIVQMSVLHLYGVIVIVDCWRVQMSVLHLYGVIGDCGLLVWWWKPTLCSLPGRAVYPLTHWALSILWLSRAFRTQIHAQSKHQQCNMENSEQNASETNPEKGHSQWKQTVCLFPGSIWSSLHVFQGCNSWFKRQGSCWHVFKSVAVTG